MNSGASVCVECMGVRCVHHAGEEQEESNYAEKKMGGKFESVDLHKNSLVMTAHGLDGTRTQLQVHGDFASEFHTFSYEWTPGGVSFYIKYNG